MENYTNLSAVLVWMASGGALLAVNWIIANLLEKWPKWHTFPVPVKFLFPLLLAIALGVGADYALHYQAFLDQIQPIFAIIITIVVGYFGSLSGHMASKNIQAQQAQVAAQLSSTNVQRAALVVQKESADELVDQLSNAPK